jgi:hypothetical protein
LRRQAGLWQNPQIMAAKTKPGKKMRRGGGWNIEHGKLKFTGTLIKNIYTGPGKMVSIFSMRKRETAKPKSI